MALQIQKPYITVQDSNGNPYVGAQLYIYQVGTTTLASVYTDDGLSIAADNPATSNAKGEFPRIYIAAGTYKLRCETSAGSLIFEEDDIDTGLSAGTGALPISRGGTGGTTAAAARSNLDVPSNSELADIASDVASLSSTIQALISAPQGRLTLTSGTPVLSSDVSAATSVYYTPYIGNLIPLSTDGLVYSIQAFSELTLTLNSNHLASTIYDLFVFNNSGTIRLVSGPAWNSSTAGSCSRGSGAGTTELTRLNGLLVNANSMTARNGATTYTVAAKCGTYVGSMWMDGSNGQLTVHLGYGQSRKYGLWNYYNRVPVILKAGDSTASWTYTTNTLRPANNSTANSLTVFQGVAEEAAQLIYTCLCNVISTSRIGIGYNSTTASSGIEPSSANAGISINLTARHIAVPAIGINTVTALEAGTGGGNSFTGGASSMMLTAGWRA